MNTPASAPPRAADAAPTEARLSAVLTVLLGLALCVADSTMVNVALPSLMSELNVSAVDVVWIVNAYQLAVLVLLLPLALLGDLYGYRPIYLGGVALFGLCGLISASATNVTMLTATRALQGAAVAGLYAVNSALVRRIYPPHQLGRGVALNAAVVATSSVAGPTLAAAILSVGNWHWLFGIHAPLAALVVVMGRRSLPRDLPAPKDHKLPRLDIALNTAMFVLLFLGVQQLVPHPSQAQGGPSGALAATLLGAGVLVALVHVRRQRRLEMPLLPVDLLRIPLFRLSICTSVMAFAAATLAQLALPFLLIQGLHFSAGQTGLVLSAWPAGTVLSTLVAARLIGRVQVGILGGVGLMLLGIGLVLLTHLPDQAQAFDVAWRLMLCGAGFGMFQSPNNHTMLTAAPEHRSGATGGMLSLARQGGQASAAMVTAFLFGAMAGHAATVPVTALYVAASLAAVACVFSAMRQRHTAR